jgi:hypothetical protein
VRTQQDLLGQRQRVLQRRGLQRGQRGRLRDLVGVRLELDAQAALQGLHGDGRIVALVLQAVPDVLQACRCSSTAGVEQRPGGGSSNVFRDT